MNEENKEQEQQKQQEQQFNSWDEKQFYTEQILPRLKEVSELLDSRNIPHLIHIVYSEDKESIGCGNIAHPGGKKTVQIAKMCACAELLDKACDVLTMAALMAMANKKA